MSGPKTFGEKVLEFYKDVQPPDVSRFDTEVINLYQNSETEKYATLFYNRFFGDIKKRIFIFGINPGRFGSGITGVPFTDPFALEKHCGIANTLENRKELSSEFMYTCINAFGGAEIFFKYFYLTAVSPVGFKKNGVNHNYYDSKSLFKSTLPFIIDSMKKQIDLGAQKRAAIVLGSGKNFELFNDINKKFVFFRSVYVLEHPRYIMQYKRKNVGDYIEKYLDILKRSLR